MAAQQKKYGAPADYAELYEEYSGYVQAVLVKLGIDQQDAVDAAGELLLRFVEKGGLGWYKPDQKFRIGTVDGKKVTLKPDQDVPEGFVQTGERTAAFMGMFKPYVGLTALGVRDRLYTLHKREVLSAFESGTTDSTEFDKSVSGSEHEIVVRASMDSAKHELRRRAVAREVVGTNRDLSRLFALIEQQMEQNGKINRQALMSELAISAKELAKQMSELRKFLSDQGLTPVEVAA